jgi:hypothetical protein
MPGVGSRHFHGDQRQRGNHGRAENSGGDLNRRRAMIVPAAMSAVRMNVHRLNSTRRRVSANSVAAEHVAADAMGRAYLAARARNSIDSPTGRP